jgi:hypothetical protein
MITSTFDESNINDEHYFTTRFDRYIKYFKIQSIKIFLYNNNNNNNNNNNKKNNIASLIKNSLFKFKYISSIKL